MVRQASLRKTIKEFEGRVDQFDLIRNTDRPHQALQPNHDAPTHRDATGDGLR
ncbi:hypothetical protein [Microbacterium sp. A84]|uniref:hypothetical protein n=1 Tax=Microbacterium sp. A84 TaxID=3450715 RepID=UPI003F41C418